MNIQAPAPILLLLLCLNAWLLQAQSDSLVQVTKNFRFKEGIYLDYAALQANTPSLQLSKVGGNLVVLKDDYLLKTDGLHLLENPSLTLPTSSTTVIVIDGLPYFYAFRDTVRGFDTFAGLRVRGRLGYLAFHTPTQDTSIVRAYNPATGRPFREKAVVRPGHQLQERIVTLADGSFHPYSPASLMALMPDDVPLQEALQKLPSEEAGAKLEKLLLIYNDRHPLYWARW